MSGPRLSARATKLLARIREGRFYKTYDPATPQCMDELIAAGLVTMAMRVETVVRAYVPTTGYTPYTRERFDQDREPGVNDDLATLATAGFTLRESDRAWIAPPGDEPDVSFNVAAAVARLQEYGYGSVVRAGVGQ